MTMCTTATVVCVLPFVVAPLAAQHRRRCCRRQCLLHPLALRLSFAALDHRFHLGVPQTTQFCCNQGMIIREQEILNADHWRAGFVLTYIHINSTEYARLTTATAYKRDSCSGATRSSITLEMLSAHKVLQTQIIQTRFRICGTPK